MTEAPTRDDTRGRVVDVAARLLAERGIAAVTTRAVADGAGVQAPTLYRLFGDKDGLLDAVAEHAMQTFVAAKVDAADEAVVADLDPVEDLRRGWETYLEFGLAHPGLATLLADPARGRSPAVLAGLAVLARRVHRLAAAGRLRLPEHRAVALVHAAGTGAVLTLAATAPADRDPGLATALWEAVARAVLVDADTVADEPVRTAALTMRSRVEDLTALSAAERRLFAEWLDRAGAG